MLNPTNLKTTVARACIQTQESMKGGGGIVRTYQGGLGVHISRGPGGTVQRFLCHERASGAI